MKQTVTLLALLATSAIAKKGGKKDKDNMSKSEWDSEHKAKIENESRYGGSADAVLGHALRQPEWRLNTGDENKGTLKMKTGWKMTGGVDSETMMQF